MNKILTLYKVQLSLFFNFKDIFKGKKNKANTNRGLGLIFLSVMFSLQLFNATKGLSALNAVDSIPGILISSTLFFIVYIMLFFSNAVLFDGKDINLLLTLPVTKKQIVSYKILFLYSLSLLISVIMIVPSYVYLIASFGLSFKYILLGILIIVNPMIAMVIGSFLGLLILVLNSKYISKSLSYTILSLIPVAIYFYFKSGNLKDTLISTFSNVNNGFLTILEIIVAAVFTYIYIVIVSNNYYQIHNMIKTSKKAGSKKIDNRAKSKFKTLYINDIRRLLASSNARLNVFLSMALANIIAIAFIVLPFEYISKNIVDISQLNIVVIRLFLFISLFIINTTAYSLSLEGNNLWIKQTSPIKYSDVMFSKVAVNMSLQFINSGLLFIAVNLKFDMSILERIVLLVTFVLLSLTSSLMGAYLNMKFPNFNWISDIVVIKQSLPVFINTIITPVIVLLTFISNYLVILACLILSLVLVNIIKNKKFVS